MGNKVGNEAQEKLMDSLGQELQCVFGQKSERSFHDLVSALRSVENTYLDRLSGNQLLSLETRRRVAELILYSATDKGVPFEMCQRAFDDLSLLGYSDLETKSTVSIIYSKYCLEVGRCQRAIELLEPLEVELQAELRRRRIKLYRHLLKRTQDVLKQLRTSKSERS